MKEYIVEYKNITNKIRKIYDKDAKKLKIHLNIDYQIELLLLYVKRL